MVAVAYKAAWQTFDVDAFRASATRFIKDEVEPAIQSHTSPSTQADVCNKVGTSGLLLPDLPESLGGGGGTFVHKAVLIEFLSHSAISTGFTVHSMVFK